MIFFTGGSLMRGFVYYVGSTWAYHPSRPYWHEHSPQLTSEEAER